VNDERNKLNVENEKIKILMKEESENFEKKIKELKDELIKVEVEKEKRINEN
jgi:hypothetical protein